MQHCIQVTDHYYYRIGLLLTTYEMKKLDLFLSFGLMCISSLFLKCLSCKNLFTNVCNIEMLLVWNWSWLGHTVYIFSQFLQVILSYSDITDFSTLTVQACQIQIHRCFSYSETFISEASSLTQCLAMNQQNVASDIESPAKQ